jgi:hypothetical protein
VPLVVVLSGMWAIRDVLDALMAGGALGCIVVAWLLPVPLVAIAANAIWRTWRPQDVRPVRVRGAILIGMLGMVSLSFALPDGWPWSAFPALGLDDTEWAPSYSAAGFANVRVGASENEVLVGVGKPLARYPNERDAKREMWCWTRSPHSSHYRVRCIQFADGKVQAKLREYWVD